MTLIVADDELNVCRSIHVTSVPFRSSVTELITNVETNGTSPAPETLMMVIVVELPSC